MKTSDRLKERKPSQKGMALISILAIGSFSMISLLSFAYLAVLLTRSEGFQKEQEFLFSTAETGLEYALFQINTAKVKGEITSIEPVEGETEKVSEVPVNFLDPLNANPLNPARVFLRVRQVSLTDLERMPELSTAYDAAFDPNRGPNSTEDFNHVQRSLFTSNYWRVIEVTATRGQRSTSLRAVLKPTFLSNMYVDNSILARNMSLGSPSDDTQIGSMAKNILELNGEQYQHYESTILSNGKFNAAPNTKILGNLQLSFPSTEDPSSGFFFESGAQVSGQVLTNAESGDLPLSGTPGETAPPSDNVKADADIEFPSSVIRKGANKEAPMDSGSSTVSTAVPAPVPNAPSDAQMLPAFSSEGATNLPTGTYTASSLSTESVTQPMVVTGQVDLYIEGSSGAENAVNINAQYMQNNGSPSNLKILYNGSKDINIDIPAGKQMNAVVYAPNASVKISGAGDYNGAVIADTLSAQSKTFNMMSPSSLQNAFGTRPNFGANEPPIGKYKIVGWQHVSGKLVSAPN